MKQKIIIVDENDEVIGLKERSRLSQGDIYRVSSLWIMNHAGEVLLARRAWSKKQHPGLWGPAVAGTVEEGEDYYSNIIKESEEELGLKDIEPILGPKRRIKSDYNYFSQSYFLKLDKPILEFKPDSKEVAEIRWIDKIRLLQEVRANPENFTASAPFWQELLARFPNLDSI